MDMWTIQNIVRVALMQVGVVIASILVGGVCHKWSSVFEVAMLPYPNWWYQYGFFGFALPIIWVVSSLHLYHKDDTSDSAKFLIFWLGVLAAIVLTILAVDSVLRLFMPDIHL